MPKALRNARVEVSVPLNPGLGTVGVPVLQAAGAAAGIGQLREKLQIPQQSMDKFRRTLASQRGTVVTAYVFA